MATTIKEFLVGLGFDVDENSERKFTEGIGRATVAVTAIGTAVIAAGGAVTAFVTKIAGELDTISDMSIRIGTTADELARLGFIAEQSDSSIEAVGSSIEALAERAGEAFTGSGSGVEVFKILGINVEDVNGELKDSTALMVELGDSIKGMARGQQISVLKRLGMSTDMLTVLTGDMAGLSAEYDKIVEISGLSMNQAAQDASDYMDSIGKLKFVFDTMTQAVVVRLMPRIKLGMDDLRKNFVENLPKIIDKLTPVLDTILDIAGTLFKFGARAGQVFGSLFNWLVKVNDASNGWLLTVGLLVGAWRLLNLTMLMNPVGAIIALGAALLLLWDDYQVFLEGGESLIRWAGELDVIMKILGVGVEKLGELFVKTFESIGKAVSFIGKIGSSLGSGFSASLNQIGDRFRQGQDFQPRNAPGSGGSNINSKTEIILQGGANPESNARAIAKEQNRVNSDLVRNTQLVTQ
ncbi:MAG: hypothetical protein KAS30_01520 [Candidatus Diapherotrites archaeon]|nr:hypothetical protein [Candidatus Diapherotrites archaeon]